MPYYQNCDTSIYFEIHGRGTPVLLLPPGGMGATIDFWGKTAFAAPEIFSEDFRVISIDQRNSGRSSGPIHDGNPWDGYLADHIGLLNHLGIERCHVIGCCIGASYALNMACKVPDRILSLVLEQPIGIDEANHSVWPNAFHKWAENLLDKRPDLDHATLADFGSRMWKDDFVLSVSREDVRMCTTPMLVLPGTDPNHPVAIAHEIAALAPNSRTLSPWNKPADLVPTTIAHIREFFRSFAPH